METQKVNAAQTQCQALLPVVPDTLMTRTQQKIWRRSHSYNSVKNFKSAVRSFNIFMQENDVAWEKCLEDPITSMDDFVGWLDSNGKSPRSTRLYIVLLKKLFREAGSDFSSDQFKARVVLPKIRMFGDDKVNKEQIRKIILTLKHQGLKTMLMLGKDTQARPMEILTLKVKNVNLAHDPPYFNIEAEYAKNDMPRELFFTNETKDFVVQRIENEGLKPNDFLFLKDVDELDEVNFQKYAMGVESQYSRILRLTLKNKLSELNDEVSGRGTVRYKIHLYSFKKFAFTIMADTLGEMATRAIKGDSEYLMTYYRKSREERVEDFRKVIPKLLVFSEPEDTRKSVEDEIKNLSKDDLADVLKFLRNGKTQFSESEKSLTKRLPVENHTGSFNKISKQ